MEVLNLRRGRLPRSGEALQIGLLIRARHCGHHTGDRQDARQEP